MIFRQLRVDIGRRLTGRDPERDARTIRRLREELSESQQRLGAANPCERSLEPARDYALPRPDPNLDRVAIFRSILEPLAPGRLVDLGCGHGKFSMAAQEMGWRVTGVDARTTRTPMTEGIEWVQSDVRDFDPSGYDCICILGLLYHLTFDDQMSLLRKCSGTLTIVDTHVAGRAMVVEGSYEGRYFDEMPGAPAEVRDATPTASWGNEVSFWPTQGSLLRMSRDCGFSQSAVLLPPHAENRTFYLFYP